MFKINAEHEEGLVSGTIQITYGSMEIDLDLGTFGPFCDRSNSSREKIFYVDFLEALRNRQKSTFCCNNYDDGVSCSFISDTDGTLTIYAEAGIMTIYKFSISMTNEIFAEMEKLVITTKQSCSTIEKAREWEEKYFPKDYVYGRGLAYV